MAPITADGGPPGRVLVVNDDPGLGARIDDALGGEDDPSVVPVGTADAALSAFEAGGAGCVVAADALPDGTGLELLAELRERDPAVPFVLLDGSDRDGAADEAFAAGVTDYMPKGFLGSGTERDRSAVLAARIRRAVTEYRSEREHRELDRRLSTLLDNLPGVVYRCRNAPSWPMEFVSDGCEALTGYPSDALESGEVEWGPDLVRPDDRAELWTEVQSALDDREPFEVTYRIVRRDGSERWLWERGRGTYDDDELVALEGYVNDVTERREYESELARKGSLLDSIFESVPAHLFVKDEDGRHVRVSGAFVDPERLIGRTDLDLAPELVDEASAREAYEDDMRVVRDGESILDKEEYVASRDQWNLTSKVPWRDADGEVVGLIGLSWEITERKRAQRALRRQNERLDQFAGVVSHDLRNPLNVAQGYLPLAREGDDDAFDRVAGALDRMDALIEDVLTLAREGEVVPDPEPVPLGEVARSAWESVDTGGASLELGDGLGSVVCDRTRVQRLFENLFRNSVEHGSTSGRAEPDDSIEHGSGSDPTPDPEDGPGDLTVRIEPLPDGFAVADDGSGIPEEVRDRVFDPGYSRVDDGTGFGLPIVEAVAAAHGWTVAVGDEESGGARFEFTDVGRGSPGESEHGVGTADGSEASRAGRDAGE